MGLVHPRVLSDCSAHGNTSTSGVIGEFRIPENAGYTEVITHDIYLMGGGYGLGLLATYISGNQWPDSPAS